MTGESFDTVAQALERATVLMQADQPGAAAGLLEDVVRSEPGHIAAWHLLGIAQRRSGRIDDAITTQERITRMDADFAAAYQELGMCHSATGRAAEAVAAFKRATELDHRMVTSWQSLGDLAVANDDFDTAFDAYAHVPAKEGGDPVLERARLLIDAGKLGRADKILNAHAARNGRSATVLYLLSQVAGRVGAVTDAMELLEAALQLDPDHHQARFDYANLLSRRQRYAEALKQADRLLAATPSEPTFRLLKAALLDRAGRYADAARLLRDMLREDPARAHVWTGLAMLQRTLGELPGAIASLHKSIDAQPERGEAWYLLADLKVFEFTDAQTRAMQASVEHAPKGSDDEVHFCFALGRALEQRRDWDAAFAYYLRGNAAMARRQPFDPDAYYRHIAALKAATGPDVLGMTTPGASASVTPIFVVGLPRAGSTLVEQMLTAHSQVDGTMELPILATLVKELNYRRARAGGSGYPLALAELSAKELAALGAEYLKRAEILRGTAPYFVDKMPNNFEHVALIRLALPQARIVDVRREPMANGFSAFRQLFQTGQDWSFELGCIGRYSNAYRGLMRHWDAVLPGLVHRVQYEDLIDSPEAEVRRLLDYVGLPVESACLRPERNARPVRTASSEQVRQPLYRHALEHWKQFERHLEPLRAALKGPSIDRPGNGAHGNDEGAGRARV